MKYPAILLAIATLLLTTPRTDAAPSEVSGTIRSAMPYGEGGVRFLFLTAYRASLWTDAADWSMETPFALTLEYRMGFDTGDLVDRTLSEIKHIDPARSDDEIAQLRPDLDRVFPTVKAGDRITALFVPGKPVTFFKDGRVTGVIDGALFAHDFFAIWLSPQTSEPDLRRKLLKLS